MSQQQTIYLTELTPSPYLLVYCIPLLLTSLVVLFSGAFLTIDRTRYFAPQSPLSMPGDFKVTSPSKQTVLSIFRLGGGVGGLASGWIFGVHLSTFMALAISNQTNSAPPSPVVFLVIWILSAFVMLCLAGRWRPVAALCFGLTGGTAISLGLCVVLHPALITRLVFISIITPIVTILCLLPSQRIQRPAIRTAGAASGCLGVIVASALLSSSRNPWANVWERLWVSHSADWGSAAEQGLSAAFWLGFVIGITTDWALNRNFGENPDQKWDAYLASYAANLPNADDRAGVFHPVTSFWQRFFQSTPKDPVRVSFHSSVHDVDLEKSATILKKKPERPSPSPIVKFKNESKGFSTLSDSDSESEDLTPGRPWLKRQPASSTSLSGATLIDGDGGSSSSHESRSNKKVKFDDYMHLPNDDVDDGECDIVDAMAMRRRSLRDREYPGWKPAFLEKAGSDRANPAPPGAVPATPSLMKALDRIAVAQKVAYGGIPTTPASDLDAGLPTPAPVSSDRWESFWREVRQVADQGQKS